MRLFFYNIFRRRSWFEFDCYFPLNSFGGCSWYRRKSSNKPKHKINSHWKTIIINQSGSWLFHDDSTTNCDAKWFPFVYVLALLFFVSLITTFIGCYLRRARTHNFLLLLNLRFMIISFFDFNLVALLWKSVHLQIKKTDDQRRGHILFIHLFRGCFCVVRIDFSDLFNALVLVFCANWCAIKVLHTTADLLTIFRFVVSSILRIHLLCVMQATFFLFMFYLFCWYFCSNENTY